MYPTAPGLLSGLGFLMASGRLLGRFLAEIWWGMDYSGLTLSYSEHLGPTCRTYALSRWFAILHRYALGILHVPFGTALHAIRFHFLTSLV